MEVNKTVKECHELVLIRHSVHHYSVVRHDNAELVDHTEIPDGRFGLETLLDLHLVWENGECVEFVANRDENCAIIYPYICNILNDFLNWLAIRMCVFVGQHNQLVLAEEQEI